MFFRINKIKESGILSKWTQDWIPEKNSNCRANNAVTEKKIATVLEFQGALYLLGLGVMSSVVTLVAEVVYYRLKMAVKQKRRKLKISASSEKPDIISMTSTVSFEMDGKITENEFSSISPEKI